MPFTVTWAPLSTFRITSNIWLEHLSDGTPVYMARDPRLPGCLSDGATVDEAAQNLRAARIDYIDSMIENGLEPPDWYNANEPDVFLAISAEEV